MEIFSFLQILLLSLFSCIILVLFIFVKWISFNSNNRKNIPPSPRRLPIIGNFHQLGSSPHRNLHILSQKYGPLMLLHLGSIPTLVASSAETAKEIMHTHDLSFCSRPSLTMANILLYGCKDVAFSPYGEYWRRMKSIMVLKLLSNARVKSYQKVRENEIHRMVQVLEQSYGTPVDMGLMFLSLINNIVCMAALGRKFNGVKLTDLIKRFIDMFKIFTIGTYIPWLSWVDQITGSIGKGERVATEFDEFLEGVIEEHVNKKKTKDAQSDDAIEDFVDILIDLENNDSAKFTLDRDSLKALILEVFVAGTETAQTSLEWTMSELIRNPRVMKKLQQDLMEIAQRRSIISEEDLEKMYYLKAIVKESMRLHPPAPLLAPHKSMHDVNLMGYDIASGTQVIINAWAIGRDVAVWEEPNEFKPERFLNSSINYQGLQFEWLPFGAGRRSCPGIQFSTSAIELALANIVYKFDMSLPNGVRNEDLDMSETFGLSMRRKSPLLVLLTQRF